MCTSYIFLIYIFCIYSDEEMTKIPETIDAGTDGDTTVRLVALLHFPTMIAMIVIPLVVFFIHFPHFFTRLCYLISMVEVVSTEDGDDEVHLQSIRMDTYGEATPSSPSRVQDTTETSSPVASDLINIDTNTYLSLVDSFPSLNESLSDTISEYSMIKLMFKNKFFFKFFVNFFCHNFFLSCICFFSLFFFSIFF